MSNTPPPAPDTPPPPPEPHARDAWMWLSEWEAAFLIERSNSDAPAGIGRVQLRYGPGEPAALRVPPDDSARNALAVLSTFRARQFIRDVLTVPLPAAAEADLRAAEALLTSVLG